MNLFKIDDIRRQVSKLRLDPCDQNANWKLSTIKRHLIATPTQPRILPMLPLNHLHVPTPPVLIPPPNFLPCTYPETDSHTQVIRPLKP
jgi:hypothetical protein